MQVEVLMAKNTGNGLKRDPVKYIRDGIKSNYKKESACEICDSGEDLELHHYHSVSFVLEKYAKELGLSLSTKEEVLAMRDEFYKIHWRELVEDTVTLCNHHHTALHKVYGQKPLLHTASKQRNWVGKQYDKAHGIVTETSSKALDAGIGYTSLLSFMV